MQSKLIRAVSGLVLIGMFAATRVAAQCEPHWLPGEGIPGVNGTVYATVMWDPDGDGPLPKCLVAAGKFTLAGAAVASNIAMWDGQKWFALGDGINGAGTVYALDVASSGELIVGGDFASASDVPASNIAIFNGATWSSLGSGTNGIVRTLAHLPNRGVIAGGDFTSAGGVSAPHIAQWAGNIWSGFAGGTDDRVNAAMVLANGDIVAGGTFQTAGGIAASRIARWNGTNWSTLGSGMNGAVNGIVQLLNGQIIAAGSFTIAGGKSASRIAQWNGSAWNPLSSGIAGTVFALKRFSNGDVYAAGRFTSAGGVFTYSLARWAGGKWNPQKSGLLTAANTDANLYSLEEYTDGSVFVGGDFIYAYSFDVRTMGVARCKDGEWLPAAIGLYGAVRSIVPTPGGGFVAGGYNVFTDGPLAHSIGRYDGVKWTPIGSGVRKPPVSLAVLSNGDLIGGGYFYPTPNSVQDAVIRWNGQVWAIVGTGFNSSVYATAVLPNDVIVAAGGFTSSGAMTLGEIAMSSGNAWQPMGSGMNTNGVNCLLALPNGDLIAGGNFTRAGLSFSTGISHWNGQTWLGMGYGISGGSFPIVWALARLPGGDIVAGGRFAAMDGKLVNNISRWDGTQWLPLGAGLNDQVYSMAVLPNGDLIAGGAFTAAGGQVAHGLARWDGENWSSFGPELTVNPTSPGTPVSVGRLAVLSNGDLFVVGSFTYAGEHVSVYNARLSVNPKPWVAINPSPQIQIAHSTLALVSGAARGYSDVFYSWSRETSPDSGIFEDVKNGLAGAAPSGGTVSGASGPLPSPTDATPATLTITNIQHSDAGNYRVTFWNSCGEATSVPVAIKVKAHIADINADGQVDDDDFTLFTQQYDFMLCADSNMPDACSADFNHDGFVDDADFVLFLPAYNELIRP